MKAIENDLEHRYLQTNGVTLHTVTAGPENGRPLFLLHGFPEFWWGWRRQIPALAEAGWRVWAPDQRGYNLSAKPHGLDAYRLDVLSKDILGLADAAGYAQFSLVGHDWGGSVAWWLALHHPERLRRLVILNCPHPRVMWRHLRQNRAQRRKSWYIGFFQLPWLPEFFSRLNSWQPMWRALQKSSRPGTFGEDTLCEYRRAWARPAAITGMINWYRALAQRPLNWPAAPEVRVPALLIWGARDRFLNRRMAQESVELCQDGHLALVEEASHWVQHEEPALVNRLIKSFLNR